MSLHAMVAVVEMRDIGPNEKLLLLILANYADNVWECWPSVKRLAADTGMGNRTVTSTLTKLEERGLIRRTERWRRDGSRMSNLIGLLFAPPANAAWGEDVDTAPRVNIQRTPHAKSAGHEPVIANQLEKQGATALVGEADDVRQAFASFNAMVVSLGGSPAKALNDDRRRRIKARLKDCGGLAEWTRLMGTVPDSPFLSGQTHHHFSVTLDFIIQPSSFTKLTEGQYHDHRSQTDGPSALTSASPDRGEQRAAARVQAMVDGARQAVTGGRRRWGS